MIIREGNASDTRHLGVVDERHELVHEAQRKERVLETVHRQTPTIFVRTVMQLRDDRVMHVFL